MNDELAAPIHHFIGLGDLSHAGSRIEIVAGGDDLARLEKRVAALTKSL